MIQKLLFFITIKNTGEENNLYRGKNSASLGISLSLTCGLSLCLCHSTAGRKWIQKALSGLTLYSIYFSIIYLRKWFPNTSLFKDICEGNSGSVCQTHRDTKWSGKNCQWLVQLFKERERERERERESEDVGNVKFNRCPTENIVSNFSFSHLCSNLLCRKLAFTKWFTTFTKDWSQGACIYGVIFVSGF